MNSRLGRLGGHSHDSGRYPESGDGARRTRRLILIGSYMEHVTGNDSEKRDRLMKGLDVFLERDRDRELFDLPNKALTG